ncbi:MAG: cell division protein FtsA [Burkholderiales bacterium]
MKKHLMFAAPAGADALERMFDVDPPAPPEAAGARAPYLGRARRDTRSLIVGLDIGTSKVVALVGDLLPDGRLEIIGMGSHESRGLKKGVVVNIESTVSAIQRALEEAELMADCKIQRVHVGIAGSHIRSFNSTGMVAIKDKEVTPLDVDRAVETARAMPIPTDQQVLHILTQEFLIDGQDGIREPLGMSGVRLEVKVHIVTGAVSAAQNVVKCVRRCGLEVADLVLQPLASSIAVLSEDERELGVALVDIGGGTTDIAIFREGAIRHTAVIPIAGDQITADVAMALRTPTPEAELVKIRHGCALRQLADPAETIEVPGLGDRPPRSLSRQTLAEVIEPRVEELYTLVQQVLRQSGFEELLSSGVVLTGGSSVMQGMAELGEEIFHMPVRLGVPRYAGGLADVVQSPRYATVMGLLAEGRAQLERGILARHTGTFRGTLRRMRQWFQSNF